jgi:O-antigen/teichoic acid export membrane protein
MISKSFLKSSLIFTVGGALPMLASIILLPFYTNYLTDVQYTQVSFYIGISLLFQVLFSYSIESYFGIEYTKLSGDRGKQKNFIGTVSILLLLIGVGLLLLSLLLGPVLFPKIYNSGYHMEFWPYGFYSVLTAFFNSYFKAASVSMIYMKKAGLFLFSNIINFLFTIIISAGGLFLFPGSIVGPMYGRLLSGVIIFVMAHVIFIKNGNFVFDKSFMKEINRFCAPYLVFALSAWVLSQFDRLILQKYIQTIDLNAYDLILKCFFGIEFLQNSLSAVIFPKLYEIWNKNKDHKTTKESNRYFNVFTVINIIQLILFCIFIPLIYKIFINKPGFYRAEAYIGLLCAGYALRGILNFYLSTILFTKKITVLLQIFGFSALIQVASTWVAVRYFGLMGAIYAGIATKILQVIFSVLFTRNVFHYEFNYFKIIVIPFLFIVINIVQYTTFPAYNIWLYMAQLALFGIIFSLVFRKEIGIVSVQFLRKNEA